jgi:flagellar hook-associated protein 2
MSSSSSAIFNGNSRYSADFQSIIDRTTAIASLPLTQMQNVKNGLQSRSDALDSLQSKVLSFQTAVSALTSALGSSSFQADVSGASVLSASTSDGVQEASYTVEVTNIGAKTSTMSKVPGAGLASVLNPTNGGFEDTGPYKLYLNTDDPESAITITPASGSLNDLVKAINSASSDVHAAIVNVGGQSGPDYRLTIQSNRFAGDTIQLKDAGGSDMLDLVSAGASVKYKINGGSEVTNDTRTLALAPGLTVNLQKQSAVDVADSITVSRNTDAVQSALSNIALSYNSVKTELDLHRGQGTGALKGDTLLSGVDEALRQITGYASGSGAISSLTSLGLSFDKTYNLAFDSSVFSLATNGKLNDLSTFLGSATGGGFLKSATASINSLEDNVSGFLTTDIRDVAKQITKQTDRMAVEQDRVDRMKTDLQARMAAADAAIASMEQQVTYYTDLFSSMRSNSSNGY